ncbi:MAG TPA: carboxypeptidase regulatory-like domain-containing protein [Thermoanaerobaculia bacterium]|nr:carboxypeptidase regulatory-like domain-containing protein [Thermoanaerobaculia bacterium]
MRFHIRALFLAILVAAASAAGAATVTGTVQSANGVPLAGMVVAAYDAAGTLRGTATTDATGLYVLTIPAGSYRVLAYDLAGVYATEFDDHAESFETSPLRSIGAGGAQVSFMLERGGTITGRVQSANGAPGAGMIVEAYNLSGTRRGFTTANAAGEYTLVVPPGNYKVLAYDPAGILAPRFHSGARSFAEATPVHVFEGAATGVFFTLANAAIVSGTAVDAATGLPLSSITVYAYTPDGALVTTATTNASGAYRFSLPAGDYRFVAADDARVYATAYYGGSRSFETSTAIDVVAGEQRGNVQLALTRGARITGHVNGPDLTIGAYNLDGTLHASATSDATGSYTLVVAPGDYRIAVSDPSMTFATLFYGGATHFRLAQTLSVTGNMSAIDVTLPRGGRISGTVRDALTTLPLAGITVAAYDEAGLAIAFATTGADGRYASVVAPGAYRIVAFDPQLNYATSYAGNASSYETTGPVAVEADAMLATNFTMRRGIRVSGTVTHQNGGALTGVEVFALDPSGNRVAGAVTNNGAFTIVVAPGTYRFVASDPLGRYAASTPTGELTIAQGQPTPTIALTLQGFSRRRSVRH